MKKSIKNEYKTKPEKEKLLSDDNEMLRIKLAEAKKEIEKLKEEHNNK